MRLFILAFFVSGISQFVVADVVGCRDAIFIRANTTADLAIMTQASGDLKQADMGLYDTCQDYSETHYCMITAVNVGACLPKECDMESLNSPLLTLAMGAAVMAPGQAEVLLGNATQLACPTGCSGCNRSCVDPVALSSAATQAEEAAALLFAVSEAWKNVLPTQAGEVLKLLQTLSTAPKSETPGVVYYEVLLSLQDIVAHLPLNPGGLSWIQTFVMPSFGAFTSIFQPAMGSFWMCGDHSKPMDSRAATVLAVSVFLLTLTLISTWAGRYGTGPSAWRAAASDLWYEQLGFAHCGGKQAGNGNDGSFASHPESGSDSSSQPLLLGVSDMEGGGHPVEGRVSAAVVEEDQAWVVALCRGLACFDLTPNLRELFSTARPSAHFSALDGLRSMSMMWVVLGHVLVWEMNLGEDNANKLFTPGMAGTFSAGGIVNAEFSVDTFFFIAGFLGSFIMTKKLCAPNSALRRLSPLSWIPMATLHRWLRLTPAVMFVIFFDTYLVDTMGSGPFWYLHSYSTQGCKKYWWTNMLYINNLYPFDSPGTCYGVTWYLPNDFQFFLLTPFLLLAYAAKPWAGKALVFTLTVASIVTDVLVVNKDDVSALMFDNPPTSNKWMLDFYMRPWTRIAPYLIGVCTALLWYEWSVVGKNRRFPRWVAVTMGAVAATLYGLTVYGTYPAYHHADPVTYHSQTKYWSHTDDVLFTALSRSGWAVALGLTCVLSFSNQAWLVGRFLGARFWMPLARLSFGMYLVHPIVLALGLYTKTHPYHYTVFDYSMTYIAALTTTALIACVLHLVVERPLQRLETLLLPTGKARQPGSRDQEPSGSGQPKQQQSEQRTPELLVVNGGDGDAVLQRKRTAEDGLGSTTPRVSGVVGYDDSRCSTIG